ncbi:MAG: hypothetical protein HY961_17160 [Ignavibacteriae bacterium]|nr:hypothetical protein [Ignavibacteriota bacterium]
MMRRTLAWVLATALIFCSCSDENKIAAAFTGDTELGEGSAVPFRLEQNYPNPFNPSTAIRFQLSTSMHVKLTVYTEDWQPVGELINEQLSAGIYLYMFNAGDLPSGDYYYVMEGNGHKQIRKMRIMK